MKKEEVKGRYFYLMLKDNFYDSDDMVLLESMENGYKYSNILLKLYLKSLKDKGKLMYKDRIPYSIEMLAKLTRHDPDVVRRAIEIFQQMGIIEILDNGAIFMMDIENYIGKSSTEADRRRAYDRRIAAEKKLLLESDNSCENSCEKSHEHIDLELELDKELDKDIEIYSPAKAEPCIPYKEIIEHLNLRTSSNYRHSTNKTKDLIKARFNEGFTLDDFKIVIDKKSVEWMNTDMQKYLRPETLFGTKFESYLNQLVKERKMTTKDIQSKIDLSGF